jgi:hypothetical protein
MKAMLYMMMVNLLTVYVLLSSGIRNWYWRLWGKGTEAIVLMSLSSSRNEPTLKLLEDSRKFIIIRVDERIADRINWLSYRDVNTKDPEFRLNFFKKNIHSENLKIARANNQKLIGNILIRLRKYWGINGLCSCTFWYIRDKDWEVASANVGIPFYVFHKENMKDPAILARMKLAYEERGYKFYGTYIFTYNEYERECIIDSKVAAADKVIVAGSILAQQTLKLAKLVPKTARASTKLVLFFSFRHLIGGMRSNFQEGGFVKNRAEGCCDFFDIYHLSAFDFARNNPSIEVVIKTKWSGKWTDEILSLFRSKRTNCSQPSNLRLDHRTPAVSLIKNSAIVLGINSTALIEARLFGKPVIIPMFAEAATKYNDRIYFKEFFNSEFEPAYTVSEMEERLRQHLDNDSILDRGSELPMELFRTYFGPEESAANVYYSYCRGVDQCLS